MTIGTTYALAGGFQSGPSPGPFYSGGMTFIPGDNSALLTGIHYNKGLKQHEGTKSEKMEGTELDDASNCYLARVDFASVVDTNGSYNSLSDWFSFGNTGHIETCSAVAATYDDYISDVYVVGSIAEGGLFSDGYPMQGLLSILDHETLKFIDATLIKSGQDPSKYMIYPLDAINEMDRNYIYIAALTSIDAEENPVNGNQEHPNWQEQQLLGSGFDVTIIKIHAPNGETPNLMWVQHFPLDTEAGGTTPPVFVAGMSLHKDDNGIQYLLVSGSTYGTGEAFGMDATPGTVDEDGFVMKLNVSDGSLFNQSRQRGDKDDFIRGMCNNRGRGHPDSDEADHFYIVGGTKSDMTTNNQGQNAGFQLGSGVDAKYTETWDRDESLMPFLRQIKISDLKSNWTTQWAATPNKPGSMMVPTNAFAMDCYLDNKGAIFVVGSVLGGDQMAQGDVEMISHGGDDIWVAKIDEATGNVFWLTQLGSANNEKLARHGSITVKEDAVIIYGDTGGSMYRLRDEGEDSESTDMFIMSLDETTGAVLDDFFLGGASTASVTLPVAIPSAEPTSAPTLKPSIDCTDNPTEEFQLMIEGKLKTKDCTFVASKKKKKKRKDFCKMKVEVNDNKSKKLSSICKETCGLVGKGSCRHLTATSAPVSSPTASPTTGPTLAPTSKPTIDCVDHPTKKFEIELDGTMKTKDCAWVALKKKPKRKEVCKIKVEVNNKSKKLSGICKETCGLVGKGVCKKLVSESSSASSSRPTDFTV
jgi:hypothetical protein